MANNIMITALRALALFFTLLSSFLGAMYLLNGNLVYSGIIAILILILTFFMIEELIKRKVNITKSKFSPLSFTLWTFYIVLSIPISFLLLHALNVELNEKTEVQKTAEAQVKSLDQMTNDYASQSSGHISMLSSTLRGNLILYTYNSNNSGAKRVLQGAPFYLSNSTLASISSSNYTVYSSRTIAAITNKFNAHLSKIKADNNSFNQSSLPNITNWSRLHVNRSIIDLNDLLKSNFTILDYDYRTNSSMTTGFNFNLITADYLIDKPVQLLEKHKPSYLLVFVILFQLILLLPYLLTPSPGGYPTNSKDRIYEGGIIIK
jgi:hypothetical protein